MRQLTSNYINEIDFNSVINDKFFYYIDNDNKGDYMNVLSIIDNIDGVKYTLQKSTIDNKHNTTVSIEDIIIFNDKIANVTIRPMNESQLFQNKFSRIMGSLSQDIELEYIINKYMSAGKKIFYFSKDYRSSNNYSGKILNWFLVSSIKSKTNIITQLQVMVAAGGLELLRNVDYYIHSDNKLQKLFIDNKSDFFYELKSVSDPEMYLKMKNVIDISNYSLNDFLQNKPVTKFKKLLKEVNVDSFFIPIYSHESVDFYYDYDNFNVICYSNGNEVKLLTLEYQRIRLTIEYYIKSPSSTAVDPFTGNVINGYTKKYEDSESVQVYHRVTGTETYYVKIYDIFVPATTEEAKEIRARKAVMGTLSDSNTSGDEDDFGGLNDLW